MCIIQLSNLGGNNFYYVGICVELNVLIPIDTCVIYIFQIGDREIDYHPSFRFLLQTKLANPHYQPEMQAQCTLINFTVTRDG